MRIRIKKARCTGCHLCEIVCSIFHLGVINTEKSAIRIKKDDLDTSMNAPVLCRQCKEMACLSGENADERVERRKFIWDRSRVECCPFKAIRAFRGQAFHCDLCGGNPQCVKVCTAKALTIDGLE
jgi:Fe-S-cluster-containing hydrogenase component 2